MGHVRGFLKRHWPWFALIGLVVAVPVLAQVSETWTQHLRLMDATEPKVTYEDATGSTTYATTKYDVANSRWDIDVETFMSMTDPTITLDHTLAGENEDAYIKLTQSTSTLDIYSGLFVNLKTDQGAPGGTTFLQIDSANDYLVLGATSSTSIILTGTINDPGKNIVAGTYGAKEQNATDVCFYTTVESLSGTPIGHRIYCDGDMTWSDLGDPETHDTNLYRASANLLATDDDFQVGTLASCDRMKTDANGKLACGTATSIALSMYDAQPARGSVTEVHGGLLSLATAQALDSVPTNIVVSKGIGKLMVVINAGSDVSGSITVTGTSVNRDTGATTGADTDTLTVDATTTDSSDTDTNGNNRYSFTGAYITSKWFTGSVTLSTSDLTLTDVDVYHVSFEQFNDQAAITLDTFDANIYTTNVNAEFDAYLYALEVTGDKCDISRQASVNVGADGETAIANRYWRLRRGSLAKALVGTTDGIWVDVHYANSPAYVEDVTLKVWATVVP